MSHPGPQLAHMRESLNLSIKQLAHITNLSPEFIASIENTSYKPHPLTISRLQATLTQLGAMPLHARPPSHTLPTILAIILSLLIFIVWLLLLVIASEIPKWV